MAAGLLGQAGLKVHVCDRLTEVYAIPRAIALDHEIMRVFQQLGVADPQGAAYKAMHYMIAQKAQILAFGDAFAFMAVCAVMAAFLALLAKPGKTAPGGRSMTEPAH